uniref:Variant surface glycoprotein 1125.28 n=1 Tax=Trypanosoma brucei TaxID=5691 RepID=M4SXV3_9TRYP|nr:variant surface glycoprotein 826 [Trypanosoma brucei]APD72581.1 variant surface glycoprotein 1125.28 [Trypanosoma brucei]
MHYASEAPVVLLVTLLGAVRAEVSEPAEQRKSCTAACSCLVRLNKLQARIESTLAAAEERVKEAAVTAQRALAIALSVDGEALRHYGPIAAVALQTSAEVSAQYAAHSRTVRRYAKWLNHLEAGYQAVRRLTTVNGEADLNPTGGTHYSQGTLTPRTIETTTTPEACIAHDNEDTKQPTLADLNKKQGFMIPTIYLKSDIGCWQSKGATACSGVSSGTDKIYNQVTLQQTAPTPHDGRAHSNANTYRTAITGGLILTAITESELNKNTTELVAAIKALDNIAHAKAASTYSSNSHINTLVATIAAQIPTNIKITDGMNQQIKNEIKTRYGENFGELQHKVWSKAGSTKIFYFSDGVEKSSPAGKLVSPDELTDAAAAGLAKAAAQQLRHCPETTSSPAESKEKECRGKTGDDCKGDCVLVDGVCKTTKKGEGENEEKGGKDGKTTNTTGSNSFVIKTSPLLLAFLLF